MDDGKIAILRSYTDKVVRVIATDGEEMIVKIILMQDEYDDFICDILSTNRPAKYQARSASSAYTIRYSDVASFAPATEID